MIRVANDKYKRRAIVETVAEAFKMLINDCLKPNSMHDQWQ